MRKLCAVLVLLGGCVMASDDDNSGNHYCGDRSLDQPFETCDDGNAFDGDGCSATCQIEYESANTFITASWNLQTVAGLAVACPVGYDTAAIYSQPVVAGEPNGPMYIDLYDCGTKIGTTAPLPGQEYLSWVEIVDTNVTRTYAQSLSAAVDTSSGDKTFNVGIYTDGGFFQLAWSLVGAQSNTPLTCAQAGVSGGIETVATDSASSTGTDVFGCNSGSGVTEVLRQGTYMVAIRATDSNGLTLGSGSALTSKQIQAPNLVTNLGTAQISIAGH